MRSRAHDVLVLGAQLMRHLVEGLAEASEVAAGTLDRDLDLQVAGRDHVGGADQAADRRDQAIGEIEPDPRRRQQHDERDDAEHQRERHLNADFVQLQIGILGDALPGRAQLLDDLRIEQADDVEIHVVVAVQFNGAVDAFGDQPDLRLGLGDLAQRFRLWRQRRIGDGDVGAIDDLAVRREDEHGRQAAPGRLLGQEFVELVVVLVEHRLGAGKLIGQGQDFAVHGLETFADISVGDEIRGFDDGARTRGEVAIEAAIERRTGDHCDQDGRNRGDDGEQADDLHMKARSGVAAAAGLDHDPDFQSDDGEQEDAGPGIDRKQRQNDALDRVDWRHPGQHQECGGGREQRHADGNRAEQPRCDRHRCRRSSRVDWSDLFDRRHEALRWEPGTLKPERRRSGAPPSRP